MAKLFCIHEIELFPGVNESEFARFLKQEVYKLYGEAGWKFTLLKGDRGQRTGKLAMLIEIESIEQRDHFVPSHNVVSEEAKQWAKDRKELEDAVTKKLASFSPTDIGSHLEYTDYAVVE